MLIMGFSDLQLRFKILTSPFILKLLLVAIFSGFLLLFIYHQPIFPNVTKILSAQGIGVARDSGISSLYPLSSSSCNKLPASLSHALIHYATSNTTPQQTLKEISVTARVLEQKSPCKFLVFGLGRDSLMWYSLNYGGRTVFLEEDKAWIEQVTSKFPSLETYHVKYDTKVRDAGDLLRQGKEKECREVGDPSSSKCRLGLKGIPGKVYDVEWDLIMVDAPTGYFVYAPGRMGAIWTAGMMARYRKQGETDLFLHDVDREVEDKFSMEFWCKEYLRRQEGRLRHFTIPSHRGDLSKPFCP